MTMPSQDGQRVIPRLPAGAYQTYQVVAPRSTHSRPVTCEQVDCPQMKHGWRTKVDETTELGQRQAGYVRSSAGRRYAEHQDEAGLTVFEFAPGQRCFAQHRQSLERPPLFVVRDGDWRGNPLGTQPRVHARAEHWVEDFAEHQAALADVLERG